VLEKVEHQVVKRRIAQYQQAAPTTKCPVSSGGRLLVAGFAGKDVDHEQRGPYSTLFVIIYDTASKECHKVPPSVRAQWAWQC
jgi:hypothetical protein